MTEFRLFVACHEVTIKRIDSPYVSPTGRSFIAWQGGTAVSELPMFDFNVLNLPRQQSHHSFSFDRCHTTAMEYDTKVRTYIVRVSHRMDLVDDSL